MGAVLIIHCSVRIVGSANHIQVVFNLNKSDIEELYSQLFANFQFGRNEY